MIKSSVARRYAKALFELLEPGSLSAARSGLTALGDAYASSAPLKHVLVSPAFGFEQKHAVLTALSQRLGCPPPVEGFLAQLIKKNRTPFLPDIADAFGALADQAKGTQQVTLTTAKTLSAAEQDGLRQQLRALLKHDVELTFHADPKLLAGAQIRIGSTIIDNTIRGRFTAMRSLLTKA